MKKIIAIALCSVYCGTAAAQKAYTLEQILDSARQHNIAIRHARQGIDAARQQRKEAFTKYFPNVSGTGLWFNANKGMAQTTITPSEFLPQSLGEMFAQLMPQQVLLDMSAPVSISMMKNGTIGSLMATQPVSPEAASSTATAWPRSARTSAVCSCNCLRTRWKRPPSSISGI